MGSRSARQKCAASCCTPPLDQRGQSDEEESEEENERLRSPEAPSCRASDGGSRARWGLKSGEGLPPLAVTRALGHRVRLSATVHDSPLRNLTHALSIQRCPDESVSKNEDSISQRCFLTFVKSDILKKIAFSIIRIPNGQ